MMNMRWIFQLMPVLFVIATGCTVGAPTSPLPSFGVDIVEATVDPGSVTVAINEGDIAHVTVHFERALKVQAFVNWEIISGIGRFIRPNGFATAAAGATSITLDLESYKNQTIEAPVSLTVNITSDSFEEPVTATIQLTDPTLPANLVFQSADPYQLPTTAVGQTVTGTLVVENIGEVSAATIAASSLSAPFSYIGGSYPGTGGNCGSLLQAGQSCTIKIQSNMAAPGVATDAITLSYNDGQGSNSTTINVEAQSDSVVATLSGTPSTLSNATVLNVTVGGFGITQYQYKVGVAASTDCSVGAGYSGWIGIGTLITNNISGLADGSLRLCVVGHDGANPQAYASATFHTWVKDTAPPSATGIAINANDVATNDLNVTLDLAATGAQFMYVTNISTCNSGGTWEMYLDSKSWVLSAPNSPNSIYVKYRDQLGNESACINDSINHDSVAPTVTMNQDVAQADPTLTTPVLFKVVFSEAVDLSSFSISAIEQKGTATGINWSLTQTSPSTFDLEAVSVDVGGTLMPEVRAGQVEDLAGNLNSVSTSTDNSVAFNMVEFYFRSLALGNEHSCGTSNEGKTYCWGSHSDGQLGFGPGTTQLLPTNVTAGDFTKIALGDNFSCGLLKDGYTVCWGRGDEYQLGWNPNVSSNVPVAPETTWAAINYGAAEKDFTDVVVGKEFVCNLNFRGNVYCWGQNNRGQFGNNSTTDHETERGSGYLNMASYPAFKNLKKISAGDEHVCGLTADGKILCWGRGTEGQIGDNGNVDRLVPVAVNTAGIPDFDGFTDLSAGGNHTCATTSDSRVYCWGENLNGQLGNNSTVSSPIPALVDVAALTTQKAVIEVKAGRTHTCGRMVDGLVYCWGSSTDGKLGGTYGSDQLVPVNVKIGTNPLKNMISLEVGRNHSCGITADGKAMCWGQQGADGRLGNNSVSSSADPLAVDVSSLLGKRSLRQISSGAVNSCAVNTQGRIFCWGRGDEGQNGNSYSDYLTPNEISTSGLAGALFAKVAVGGQHVCGLSTEGKVYCWGENSEGQLGNGGNVDNPTPSIVDTSTIVPFLGFKDISTGTNHTCGLHADGKIYCWGYGFFGQLGRNSSFSANRPVAVVTASTAGLNRFAALDAGNMHTCGLGTDGLLYCWGYGSLGRLGTGNTLDRMVPTAVVATSFPAQNRVASFSAGNENTCAILTGYTKAWCWGNGIHGRNGDFTELSRTSPVQLDTSMLTNFFSFKTLDVGQEHACAIDSRGVLLCWGEGAMGRIGDGPELYRTRPVAANFTAFASYTGSVGVTSGGSVTCSWSYNGEQYCWGEGLEGRLGNNITSNKVTPSKMVYP